MNLQGLSIVQIVLL